MADRVALEKDLEYVSAHKCRVRRGECTAPMDMATLRETDGTVVETFPSPPDGTGRSSYDDLLLTRSLTLRISADHKQPACSMQEANLRKLCLPELELIVTDTGLSIVDKKDSPYLSCRTAFIRLPDTDDFLGADRERVHAIKASRCLIAETPSTGLLWGPSFDSKRSCRGSSPTHTVLKFMPPDQDARRRTDPSHSDWHGDYDPARLKEMWAKHIAHKMLQITCNRSSATADGTVDFKLYLEGFGDHIGTWMEPHLGEWNAECEEDFRNTITSKLPGLREEHRKYAPDLCNRQEHELEPWESKLIILKPGQMALSVLDNKTLGISERSRTILTSAMRSSEEEAVAVAMAVIEDEDDEDEDD